MGRILVDNHGRCCTSGADMTAEAQKAWSARSLVSRSPKPAFLIGNEICWRTAGERVEGGQPSSLLAKADNSVQQKRKIYIIYIDLVSV
jgi:hypothetical protein